MAEYINELIIDKVIFVLGNEKECIKRNIAGCDRDCEECDLVLPDTTILSAYDFAIDFLSRRKKSGGLQT